MPVMLATAIGLAIIAGCSVALQVSLNNVLSAHVGNLWTIFVSHIGGALLAVLIIVTIGAWHVGGAPVAAGFRAAPLYSMLGGVMGVIMVGAVLTALRTLSLGEVLALVTFGQLALALVIDHVGLFGVARTTISLPRLGGVVLLVAGTYLLRR